MDGITITIDGSTLAILIFVAYKIASIEMRLRRLEERIFNSDNK